MANTLYDTLEVIPTASPETIHAAYRSLISRYHPDKVAGLGPELQAIANVRTKEINHAYDILGHAARRASYDKELRDIESPPLQQQRYAAGAQWAAAARPIADKPRGRRLRAPFVAALAAVAALLTLPHAANLIFGVADFLVTGHTRYFQDFVNSVDADVRYSGFPYLLILWGWLFVGYLFGLISYLFGIRVGEGIALRFGEPFAGNERLFLFLTFVCVIAARELFFSAHTLASVLTDMFVLAGAYRAALGTASSAAMPEAEPEGESAYRS